MEDHEETPYDDPRLYAAWKKETFHKLKQHTIFRERIPAVLKRCPKCTFLSLEFNPTNGRLYCNRCGFEEHVPM